MSSDEHAKKLQLKSINTIDEAAHIVRLDDIKFDLMRKPTKSEIKENIKDRLATNEEVNDKSTKVMNREDFSGRMETFDDNLLPQKDQHMLNILSEQDELGFKVIGRGSNFNRYSLNNNDSTKLINDQSAVTMTDQNLNTSLRPRVSFNMNDRDKMILENH